jgi:hypothetical protein
MKYIFNSHSFLMLINFDFFSVFQHRRVYTIAEMKIIATHLNISQHYVRVRKSVSILVDVLITLFHFGCLDMVQIPSLQRSCSFKHVTDI